MSSEPENLKRIIENPATSAADRIAAGARLRELVPQGRAETGDDWAVYCCALETLLRNTASYDANAVAVGEIDPKLARLLGIEAEQPTKSVKKVRAGRGPKAA